MMTATEGNTTPRVVRDCTLDWVKIDTHVMRDPSLSPPAKALYGILCTFADRETRVSDEDPDGFDVPSRKGLAFCMGKSVDTVDRVTAELEAYRLDGRPLLIVERRSDPQNPKSNLPSVYHLLDHEHWDARAAERHAARGSRKSAARGGRTDAARGSRKSAARGGRTDAAVPFTAQKTTTHRVREDVNEAEIPEQREAETVVVVESLNPKTAATAESVLSRSNPVGWARMTGTEQGDLVKVTAALIERGWSVEALVRKLDRRTDENTRLPYRILAKAVADLGAPPAVASAADPVQTAASRARAADAAALAGARDDALFAMRSAKLVEPHTPEWNRLAVWIKGAPLAELQAFSNAPTLDVLADLPQAPPRRRKFAEAAAALSGSISI